MAKVSINLVTWNGERYIENCLRSIATQTFSDYSVIIIDNGSTDKTVELIRERYPHLKIVQNRENLGFAKGHNQAIHWSRSEYILCLNQDVVLDKNFLAEAVEFLDKNQMVGAVAPKLLRLQDDSQTNYIDSLGLKVYKNHRVIDIASGEVDEGQYDVRQPVFGASGAAPIYRRKALEEVKYQNEYFDEQFESYKEDVDLAYRLQIAGWQAYYLPTVLAYHDRTLTVPVEKMTKAQVLKNRRRKSSFANHLSYRNHLYFLSKCLPRFNRKFLWPVFWYELTKFFYVLCMEIKTLKAWPQLLRARPLLKLKREVIWKNKKVTEEEISKWFSK